MVSVEAFGICFVVNIVILVVEEATRTHTHTLYTHEGWGLSWIMKKRGNIKMEMDGVGCS